MKLQERYTYPAIFSYEDDGIVITFPDLQGCISQADNDGEAVTMARDALGLWLSVAEREGYKIPAPTKTLSIKHEENQAVVLIDVFMPAYRDNMITKSARQTVTVPVWLLSMAKKNKINFSQTLQDALKSKLGIARDVVDVK